MAASAPRTEAENEAALAAPAPVVSSRERLALVGVGPVGVFCPQPAVASQPMRQIPRLTMVSFRECGNRIVLSV
jgi:hypothetical protein